MRATAPLQQSHSREVALAAIAEAHRAIGQSDRKFVQPAEPEKVRGEMFDLLKARAANLAAKAWRSMLMSRSFVGLLALACIGIAVAAWQSSRGQVPSDPISTSSTSVKKQEEVSSRPASTSSDLVAKTSAALPEHLVQAPPQSAPVIPMAAPPAPELTQQIQLIARELENVGQGIDQLKNEQSQMIRENAELTEQIKATQEIARHNADLTADLKAAQAQMARDNGNLASQLKAGQDLMANIAEQLKESQEKAASLAASEQKQRPKPRTASTPAIATLARKPVVTPPPAQAATQAQTQAQASRRVQPKQQ